MAHDPLRAMLVKAVKGSWRRKAFRVFSGGRHIVALDGHHLWSSCSRCCDERLQREVKTRRGIRTEYYHRVVVAQWVAATPPAILDFELVRPGEGEVQAAERLWRRVVENYGCLIDVFTLDALYAEGPFLRGIIESGKDFVVVLKQEVRDLYQDAEALRPSVQPKVIEEKNRTSHLWDIPDLATFPTYGRPIRMVISHEETVRTRIIGGEPCPGVDVQEWRWITSLGPDEATAQQIQQWGHDRWDIENRCFNELVQRWHMDHAFRHDPNAILAILFILAIAFLTTYLFYERNVKPERKKDASRLAMAAWLLDALAELAGGASVWANLLDSS